LLLTLIYFANLGEGHAVLPAFVLGLFMSKYFGKQSEHQCSDTTAPTVAYAIITPIFSLSADSGFLFRYCGEHRSFSVVFLPKNNRKIPRSLLSGKKIHTSGSMYTTLLMSTGLTFGTISSLFGCRRGSLSITVFRPGRRRCRKRRNSDVYRPEMVHSG